MRHSFPHLIVLALCGVTASFGYGSTGAGVTIAAPVPPPAAADTGRTDVYFLLDEKALLGCGHAAVLAGDDRGWHYFSFALRGVPGGPDDNLESLSFPTLDAARRSPALARYHQFLRWQTADRTAVTRVTSRAANRWDHTAYDPVRRNCYHMTADLIAAAGLPIDGRFTTPVAAFAANRPNAADAGAWPAGAE